MVPCSYTFYGINILSAGGSFKDWPGSQNEVHYEQLLSNDDPTEPPATFFTEEREKQTFSTL